MEFLTIAVGDAVDAISAALDLLSLDVTTALGFQMNGGTASDTFDIYESNRSAIATAAQAQTQAQKIVSVNGLFPSDIGGVRQRYLYVVRTAAATSGLSLLVTGQATTGGSTNKQTRASFAAGTSLLDAANQYVPPGSGDSTSLTVWYGGVFQSAVTVQRVRWALIGDALNVAQTLSVGFQKSSDGGSTWSAVTGASKTGIATTAGAHCGYKDFTSVSLSDGDLVRAYVLPSATLAAPCTNLALSLE